MTKDDDTPLDRRQMLGLGVSKVAEAAAGLSGLAPRQRTEFFRPPFALSEPDFLLACTRCDKCIEACPHGVLFRLPDRMERLVAGTPAMDLVAHGCHMCADAPCVTACEPGALALPTQELEETDAEARAPDVLPVPAPEAWPKFGRAKINTATCLPYSGPECGACQGVCPVPHALEWADGTKPVINPDVCTGCGMCREACIMDPKAIDLAPLTRSAGRSSERPIARGLASPPALRT